MSEAGGRSQERATAEERAAQLGNAAQAGDRRALARLLTEVENRTPVGETALRRLYAQAGTAHLVGVTGAPGAGKSTLVAALVTEARKSGRPVAVLAVDPSSPITGGAILGDRVRMQLHAADDDVFIRSMASRGHGGGLAGTTIAAAAVLDACGFELIFIETVGTGQSEVEVAAIADTTIVVQSPEMGDEVQAIKAGMLEVADLVVVTKGDRPGAERTASQLRAMLTVGAQHDRAMGDRPRPKRPDVLLASGLTGTGVADVVAALDRRTADAAGPGAASDRGPADAAALKRADAQVAGILAERVRARLHDAVHREQTTAILARVARHEEDPYSAADRLLALVADSLRPQPRSSRQGGGGSRSFGASVGQPTAGAVVDAETSSLGLSPAPAWLRSTVERLRAWPREWLALLAVHGAALAALVAGMVLLRQTDIGPDPQAVIDGLLTHLPVTLPVALGITIALAANILGGSLVMRMVSGEPYRSISQAVLCGLAGAILLDLVALGVLATIGLFHWPLLMVALATPLLLLPRAVPFIERRPSATSERPAPPHAAWSIGWLLIVLLWGAPVLFSLSSPVVPFIDVPPNHVAPVEHLRTFGSLDTLTTLPDASTGPSRALLGYGALLGVLVTLEGSLAATGVGQFAIPMTLLVALAGYGFARALGGPAAGRWALLLLPLSVTFLRLTDARANVLVFALAALAFWLAIEPLGRDRLRRVAVLGGVVGAALYVHPLVGLYSAAMLGLAVVIRPAAHAGHVWPALGVGMILALPQFGVTASLPLPPWVLVLAIPLALAGVYLFSRLSDGVPILERRLIPLAAAGALALGLAFVTLVVPAHFQHALERLWPDNGYPLIALGTVLAALIWRRRGMELVAAAVLLAYLVNLAAELIPRDWPMRHDLHGEALKWVFLTPTVLALAGGVGLAALWHTAVVPLGLRVGAAVLVLILVATPLTTQHASDISLGEHRWAESTSISLRNTGRGGWVNFPDWRWLINAEQRELVARVREEINAGRLTASTRVIQVAWSSRSWAATPLGVFTGAMVTIATPEPEISTHTVGGRIHHIDELPALLGPAYAYVVLEPAGVDEGVRDLIVEAGYQPIWANDRVEMFLLPRGGDRLG